jgi:hypothetical protein
LSIDMANTESVALLFLEESLELFYHE